MFGITEEQQMQLLLNKLRQQSRQYGFGNWLELNLKDSRLFKSSKLGTAKKLASCFFYAY